MRALVTNRQLRRELRNAERTIEARDLRIAGLIIDRDTALRAGERLTETLSGKQKEVDLLAAGIGRRDAEIHALSEQREKDRAEFTRTVDGFAVLRADTVAPLQRDIAERDAEIASLRRTVVEHEYTIELLRFNQVSS